MKTITVREFADLSAEEQKNARNTCINSEVKFRLENLNSDLIRSEITEEEYWKEIGCSKHYGESTPWFVGAVYYEHHQGIIDQTVKEMLEDAAFDSGGKTIYIIKP